MPAALQAYRSPRTAVRPGSDTMFIRLEAIAPKLGICRLYELMIERDLFD